MVTFTERILNEKLHFLCSVKISYLAALLVPLRQVMLFQMVNFDDHVRNRMGQQKTAILKLLVVTAQVTLVYGILLDVAEVID